VAWTEVPFATYTGEIIAVLVIFAVTAASFALERLEGWARRHRHVHELLTRSYRELTLLGIISLVLFIIQEAGALRNSGALTRLQYLHVAVFAVVITFVLYVVLLLLSSRRAPASGG
jgi:hypothetical protein